MNTLKIEINNNKYDIIIIIIIGLASLGIVGGGIREPLRMIAVLSFPFVLNFFLKTKNIAKAIIYCFLFFSMWWCFSLVSLLWTSDFSQGTSDFIAYNIFFLLFWLIVISSLNAKDPLNALIKGWSLFFLLTIPVAIWEILFDLHLPMSKFDENSISIDGVSFERHFASVTFFNQNTYTLVLIYAFPFILARLLQCKKILLHLFQWLLVACFFYIIIINSSRAGLLCTIISFIIFLRYYGKSNFKYKKFTLFCFFIFIVTVLVYYSKEILLQISLRFAATGGEIFNDSTRTFIIYNCFKLIFDTPLWLGSGVGSMIASLSTIDRLVPYPHNLFLEIWIQNGWVVLLFFILMLMKFFLSIFKMSSSIARFIMISTLITFPVSSVLNSTYLNWTFFWIWFASIFILATDKRIVNKSA